MALEWLKTILGEAYNEETDKKVSEQIGKSFVSKEDFNTVNNAKKTLETQLSERDKQLEELKKIDTAGLQAQIEKLQGENKTAKEKYEADIKNLAIDSALNVLLTKSKAKHPELLLDKINREKITLKEDGKTIEGADEELKRLKESYKDLFGSKLGGDPPPNPEPGGADPKDLTGALAQYYTKNND